uniref:Uncharacterized protein n=1 Tax=mine drainage metagenome TaxID=410659 RepID=E6Q7R7_9ZZZZ
MSTVNIHLNPNGTITGSSPSYNGLSCGETVVYDAFIGGAAGVVVPGADIVTAPGGAILGGMVGGNSSSCQGAPGLVGGSWEGFTSSNTDQFSSTSGGVTTITQIAN